MTNNWVVGFKLLIVQLPTFIVFTVIMLIILSSMFANLSGKVLLTIWSVLSIPIIIWFAGLLANKIWSWK